MLTVKMFFKSWAVPCAIAGAAVAVSSVTAPLFAEAAPTNFTTTCMPLINALRREGLDSPLTALTANTTGQTAVETLLTTVETADCIDPTADQYPSAYDMNWYRYTGDVGTDCATAVNAWYGEHSLYRCAYPPADDFTGEVRSFSNMMASDVTGVACAKSADCDNDMVMCFFNPKSTTQPRTTPFSEDVWKTLIKRDNICSSGSYYGKFAGLITTFVSLSLAWSYVAA